MVYSLKKSRKILRTSYALFEKKRHTLSQSEQEILEADLHALDDALLAKDRVQASEAAERVEIFCKGHFSKTLWEMSRELVFALLFAIVVAFGIRQFWFELYEVPTGSMRPTIGELDRLLVSKTTFGIHPPFQKSLLFYSPDYIERAGIIVLTTEDMDMADSNMLYFGIFPGKKRFVKRCVSKPGDTLYFYGGYIYGIDKQGEPFTQLSDPSYLQSIGIEKIDHVPFITFDGKTKVKNKIERDAYASATLKQMNLPVGKLDVSLDGQVKGTFFNGKHWIKDDPNALKSPHNKPASYSDLWGFGNFAMARLLTSKEVKEFYNQTPNREAKLYLELHHTPNLTYPKPQIRRGEGGKYYPMITPYTALIPLDDEHLQTLQQALYTSRFCVKNGHAYSYHKGRKHLQPADFDPLLPKVSNGCYEFYYGQGYRVYPAGFRRKLATNDPLYSLDLIRTLFNQGIGWNKLYDPMAPLQPYNPQRFAYYRDGDLYVMGAPLLKKEDPTLVQFVSSELEKQKASSSREPYIAFVDHGPPPNIEFIRNFGLKVPDDAVVGLGDNYANSGDSRDFGFVPTNNLRGAPSFTFWPISKRLGPLAQPPYPWITFPNILVWVLAALIIWACYYYVHKKNKRSIFSDKDPKE